MVASSCASSRYGSGTRQRAVIRALGTGTDFNSSLSTSQSGCG